MRKISIFFTLFYFFCIITVFGQQSIVYTNELVDYNKALMLYKNNQYLAAQILFDQVALRKASLEIESDCYYYSANCAIRLEQSNAEEKMENFVKNYPSSSKQNLAYTDAAVYYFEHGDYKKAIDWFEKVNEDNLTNTEKEKFNFYKAYSFFKSGKNAKAIQYFNKVINSQLYGSQAKYYLGFLAYQEDDYKEASKYFDEVSGEEKYKEKLSYFQADMNFKLGKFEKAIELGNNAMVNSNAVEKSELNKIIGESYFNLKQYDKAIPHLKAYQGKKRKWNNTDYYQLGYAYYKQNNYEEAINQFNKIIITKDAVAQNAYYHLGESYLKTDKKQQALHAFKNASEMDFDLKIQEDSYLNYARLSYDIGNSYQSVPDVLTAFITKYPESPSKIEIENLLINSFITSKNYKDALELLEKSKSISKNDAYQKVCFYRGLEHFTDGNYKEANEVFIKSIAQQKNLKFSARATFWKAETEFTLEDFPNALITFKQFIGYPEAKNTPEFLNVNYNIAYAYFKLKEYTKAGEFFEKYINDTVKDATRLTDAYLRLADCQFVASNYTNAIKSYEKVMGMKTFDTDYAAFQKAICYGFMNKNNNKIDDFNLFLTKYPKSQYRDDALFELANTYTIESKTVEALKTYDKLLTEFKNGSFSAKAILRQGLIHYNSDKDDLALVKFKKVTAEYPRTEEALEAVKTARLIYVDSGKVDEYATWVKSLDFIEISNDEIENDSWLAAEKQYLLGNAKQAIPNLSSYLKNFPEGSRALKANFYLAQSLFADSKIEEAVKNYDYVVNKPRSEYTEQSLSRLCEIYLKQKLDTKAIPVLKRLEVEADFPQNITYAQANLMRISYDTENYNESVIYAEKVLSNPKTDNKIKSDAQIIIARSAINTNEEVKAEEAYAKLQKIAKGELAAEALYYEAYFKNKKGKYQDSNNVIQKLAKDYSGYKYFGAKGLVLMAKNFYALKDSFQATYILESVITNFSDFNEIIEDAQKELEIIKKEEAKTNSSVTE